MLWKDVNFDLILVSDKKITYNGKPFRFQIPRGYSEYGLSDHKSVNFFIQNDEFFEWFKRLEEYIFNEIPDNFESNISENSIRIKYVEGFTQVFDSKNTYLMDGHTFVNCEADVLIDISSTYSPFKDFTKCGLVCKMYQVRVMTTGCLF